MSVDYLAWNISLHEQIASDAKKLLSRAECSKFPCAGWIADVATWAANQGIVNQSGQQAIQLVKDGIDPKRIAWIQDGFERMNEFAAWRAIPNHASRTILYNMESPLFVPFFWDRQHEIEARLRIGLGVNKQPTYPAYRSKDFLPVNPDAWGRHENTKMPLAVVFSNRWNALMPDPGAILTSPAYRLAIANEQQTKRFRILQKESFNRRVHVAGPGFDAPSPFQLKEYGVTLHGPIDNKFTWLNQFPFTLALENTDYPGYFSEKEYDAIVAGSYPVNKAPFNTNSKDLAQSITNRQYDLRDHESRHPASEQLWVNIFQEFLCTM